MFSLDFMNLFCMIFFSMIGMAYIAYGKKESVYYKISGILLLIYPYMVDNIWVIGGLGVFFMLLPFILDRLFPL